MQRRLAAVLVIDVVGYSRLMRRDEEGTLERITLLRNELIDPIVDQFSGRIIKLMGDGMLLEFASVSSAVNAATDIQEAMQRRNHDIEDQDRIVFRMGINLGDIITSDNDIFGDGVNIAARLETLSPVGGVCISDVVHEQIRDRTPLTFTEMGPQQLKNIDRDIDVWSWEPNADQKKSVSLVEDEFSLPEKPSIAVLPFDNMSSDPDHEYFADGIAEDILTALSRIEWFFVTARNSSFTYKGRAVDVQQIGKELGVRYVLEGSVRSSGNRLRVTAQLIDATTGHHVWAERYDREMNDIFDVQDEITRNVVASLQTQIQIAEAVVAETAERVSLPVWALVNKSWKLIYQMTEESLILCIQAAEEAVQLDPGGSRSNQALASGLFHQAWMGFAPDPSESYERALKFSERSVRSSPNNEYARWILGMLRLVHGEHDKAIAELTSAIEINPNCSIAYGALATCQNFAGFPDQSIVNNEIAIRSNPRDPTLFYRYTGMGLSHYMIGRFDEAIDWLTKSVHIKAEFFTAHALLIASYHEAGMLDECQRSFENCMKILPTASTTPIQKLPFRKVEYKQRLLDSLAAAGLENAKS
ncbi:MAG: adenylate/guanylate cyclase domain-containing protein [Pseudomonadota bacterium]